MKTLKLTLMAFCLLFVCTAINATANPIPGKINKTDVINIYVDAVTHGNTQKLNNILDDNMEYDLKRGDNVNTSTKSQFVNYVKASASSGESPVSNITLLMDDDDTATFKVEFKYNDSIRTDVVTLNKTSDWQVIKIVSSFK